MASPPDLGRARKARVGSGKRTRNCYERRSDNPGHGGREQALEEVPVAANERTTCLDPETLAALADGNVPAHNLSHVRAHLPECSKCLDVLAFAARGRAGLGSPARGGDTLALPRRAVARRNPRRAIAVVLSFVALGSSAAWWRFDGAEGVRADENRRGRDALPITIQEAIVPSSARSRVDAIDPPLGDGAEAGPATIPSGDRERPAPAAESARLAPPIRPTSRSPHSTPRARSTPDTANERQPRVPEVTDANEMPPLVNGRRIRTTLDPSR